MKFKTIFFLFNAVVIISFLFIFLMPLFFLGGEYALIFWQQNWYLALLFAAVIALLDTYFIRNWQIFQFLEGENWKSLQNHLEERIFNRGKADNLACRLWINTCLAHSELEGVQRLSDYLEEHRPRKARRFALYLGIPALVQDSADRAVAHFDRYRGKVRGAEGRWIRWCRGFALSRRHDWAAAREEIVDLLPRVRKPELLLLTLYLLHTLQGGEELPEAARDRCREWRRRFPSKDRWAQYLQGQQEGQILLVLLSSMLDDAAEWCLKEASQQEESGPGGSAGEGEES